MSSCKPIETLACDNESSHVNHGYSLGSGLGNLLLWFIVIAVIVWFILWALKPRAVQRLSPNGDATGEVDTGKVLIGAIVIALIIVVILWLFRACSKY